MTDLVDDNDIVTDEAEQDPEAVDLATQRAEAAARRRLAQERIAAEEDNDDMDAEPTQDDVDATLTRRRKAVHAHRATCGTGKAYGQWNREWHEYWAATAGDVVNGLRMDESKRPCSPTVTPYKASVFLEQYVACRPALDCKGQPIAGKTVGMPAIRLAAKAISSIYKDQLASEDAEVRRRAKRHPNPRDGGLVKDVIAQLERQKATRFETEYVDRGLQRGYLEGFSESQRLQLSQLCIEDSALSRPRNKLVGGALLHLVLVFGFVFSCRYDDLQRIKLADLFLIKAPAGEGPMAVAGKCYYLTIGRKESKMNKEGRPQMVSALRHATDPVLCAWFALACSFFVLYEVMGVEAPDFAPSVDSTGKLVRLWYHHHCLPGRTACSPGKQSDVNPKRPLGYKSVYDAVKWAYSNIADPVSKQMHCVHVLRGASLRTLEQEGVSQGQIERHGGYRAADALRQSYLIGPAYDAMRVMAGFPPEKGHYFVTRALLEPPEALVAQVFPSLLKHAGTVLDPNYEHR